MNLPSRLMEDAVESFTRLPGIGRKTALRLVLHLLSQDPQRARSFGESVIKMREGVQFCKVCHNASDKELCSICENSVRSNGLVCVVEHIRDLLAIEQTGQFNGSYHILGGLISPIDGIGPEQLHLESLTKRVKEGKVRELIMALSPTIEGDTTIYYVSRQLHEFNIKVTTIARGVSFGGELEYVDELTLARSIATRLPYQNYLPDSNG